MVSRVALIVLVVASVCRESVVRSLVVGPAPSDHCTVTPVSSRNHPMIVVETNPSCINGSIWWQYPQNEMKVNFHTQDRTHTFIACIQHIQEPQVHNIYDLTGHVRVLKPLPPKGGETCSNHSIHGTATLSFVGPTGPEGPESYMAFIDYRLKLV